MKTSLLFRTSALSVILVCSLHAGTTLTPPKPNDPYFDGFEPRPAPPSASLMLKKGDRLAICGDSITEQKQYSRMIETYLTVCVPELEITTRQYGWSGETASGFLARMTNDCLRFKPTIATTCYGMNDHRYTPYTDEIGDTYRKRSTAIVQSFKANGVRVIHGSPGCVGKMPGWVKSASGTVRDLNLNLSRLREIGIDIAAQENTGFADVFWPMFAAGFEAQKRHGTNFAIAGKDGVHPGWAGQTVMAYAFLKAMGLDGEIGTFTVDLQSGKASASNGHEIVSAKSGTVEIKSRRYPFCATGPANDDGSIRAAWTLIPFNEQLNRLTLIAKNGTARNYKVTWGAETKTYSAAQLAAGVNLASDFAVNPFSTAFAKVDKAVGAKQAYETKQIKSVFHGLGQYKSADAIKDPEVRRLWETRGADGKWNKDLLAGETEKVRAPLAQAIKDAFEPVTHSIQIEAQ